MGKTIILLIIGGVISSATVFYQVTVTSHDSRATQTSYEEEYIARHIAESALGLATSRAQESKTDITVAMSLVNSIAPTLPSNAMSYKGDMCSDEAPEGEGETPNYFCESVYTVSATPIDGQNFRIEATGYFGEEQVTVFGYFRVDMLVVNQPSRLRVDFIESWAGYCSAVWLERIIPVYPGDVFDPAEGTLSSDGKWFVHNPEMVFDSGHYRDGASTTPADINLSSGTRINFFIGVDMNCSEEGNWVTNFDENDYDHMHYALESDVSDLTQMEEGKFAMIQAHTSNNQRWRIAFEDLTNFSDAQHADVKANSYGDAVWDAAQETYGGTGWSYEPSGYYDLDDYGGIPDYSDQVIEIGLIPCGGVCPPEGVPLN